MRKFIGKWIPADIAYYLHLDDPKVIKSLQYRYKGCAIVYGIRCQMNGMIYIGGSISPALRFHKHLITGEQSNANLQADINMYGLGKFTVHIFKIVEFPPDSSFAEKKALLLAEEQEYLNMIPVKRRYNSIEASSTTSK